MFPSSMISYLPILFNFEFSIIYFKYGVVSLEQNFTRQTEKEQLIITCNII